MVTTPRTQNNDGIPARPEYIVAGTEDAQGRKYVYALTAGHTTVDAFIRDLSEACKWKDEVAFQDQAIASPRSAA